MQEHSHRRNLKQGAHTSRRDGPIAIIQTSHQLFPGQQWSIVIRHVPPENRMGTSAHLVKIRTTFWGRKHDSYQQEAPTVPAPTYARRRKGHDECVKSSLLHLHPIAKYRKNNQGVINDSFALRGGRSMMSKSGGLKPRAVAGRPSVTKFTHNSWTGINDSGRPNAAVKKMHTTYKHSPLSSPSRLRHSPLQRSTRWDNEWTVSCCCRSHDLLPQQRRSTRSCHRPRPSPTPTWPQLYPNPWQYRSRPFSEQEHRWHHHPSWQWFRHAIGGTRRSSICVPGRHERTFGHVGKLRTALLVTDHRIHDRWKLCLKLKVIAMVIRSRPSTDTGNSPRVSWFSLKMPIRRQMASAVFLLSPVIMMTRIPASRQRTIASITSERGGSSIPTTPTNVMFV